MKPDKPGELRDVTVNAISLVPKAANGERFKVFKSAEEEPKTQVPETVKKDERGLFYALKKFFTSEDVEKGAVTDLMNAQDNGRRLGLAIDALFQVLGLNRWGECLSEKIETDPLKIREAFDDFRAVSEKILLGSDEDIKKAVAEIEKSGRKISGSRLSKLKSIQAMLNEVLSGLDENENNLQEAEELTKEDVQEIVKEARKAAEEAVQAINVKKAIDTVLAPVLERLEKIENARGVSNRVQEDNTVEKNANDFWGGIF